ncbi:MAG: hypothetical protein GY847_00375 [Proteobacteria bacterium]|nr:hypothetical protein [Pseudomonadota bacterium]
MIAKNRISVFLVTVFFSTIGGCLCLGCESGDVTINLLAYDAKSDSYNFKDVKITTLNNVEKLEGATTRLLGEASLELNYQGDYLEWKETGRPVAFQAIKENGVLIPEDFHSLAMVSTYYNLELSRNFFVEELDLPADAMGALPTYYWPKLSIIEKNGDESEMVDNAFYMYMTEKEQAFFIVPFDDFQWIPMSLNTGIITHEYTHAVFDVLVFGLADLAPLTDSGTNFLYGLNEGTADFMAIARTGDPRFIRHSIPFELMGSLCNGTLKDVVRDASIQNSFTWANDNAARSLAPLGFCPYEIGSFFASLLYEIAGTIGEPSSEKPSDEALKKVASWLLDSLADLGAQLPQDFEIWHLLSLFVLQIDSQVDRDTVCELIDKYDVTQDDLLYIHVEGC